MFSNKLKRPALAFAVTAALLAVAGPASAGVWVTSDAGSGDDNFASSEVFELNTYGGDDTVALIDKTMAEDSFTSLPELPANANAFLPEANDEVASLNYEIDVFW